eukprot:TRINITY_DN21758_c0_g1_i1.p2 TRINITY_DN21758_c0_g1~~TRINITY_DN21758_c0_g1_i1.p2  ORF type:complete len:108 (-),score=18.24 TRINITY_DN21758_c0_g1_i1:493-816(-)
MPSRPAAPPRQPFFFMGIVAFAMARSVPRIFLIAPNVLPVSSESTDSPIFSTSSMTASSWPAMSADGHVSFVGLKTTFWQCKVSPVKEGKDCLRKLRANLKGPSPFF